MKRRSLLIFTGSGLALVLLLMLVFIVGKRELVARDKDNKQTSQNNSSLSLPKTDADEKRRSASNQLVATINDSLRNTTLPGRSIDNSELLLKYGKYAFETFQKSPILFDKVKSVDPSFDPSQMDASFPSRTYQLNNGKEYLALSGCTPHDCAGTKIIVIYNEKEDTAYIAKENTSETQLQIIGDPPQQERDLLIYHYFHN